MSQAGQTRYFARSTTPARSARRGKEKNKYIFLFPSSRASRSCRAPREISRLPRLAHKAPVMQAISGGKGKDGSEKRRELKAFLSLLPLPPPPSKNLLSPSPSGRPDTQARNFLFCCFVFFQEPWSHLIWLLVFFNMAIGEPKQK